MNLFQKIISFTNDMNKTNKTLEKKETLKKYSELKELFKYVYDKNIVFSIKSSNYKKYKNDSRKNKDRNVVETYTNIFYLLDDLANRKITGDTALMTLYYYIEDNKEYEDIILKIIDKNLKVRVNIKVINDVFPNLIQTFDVVLANKFKYSELLKDKIKWYISRKLDGVRCLAHMDKENNKVIFYSRQGKVFNTLGKLENELLSYMNVIKENCFLDGEVVDITEEGVENFKGIMEKIRKKNYTIENPKYYTFDIINEKDFYNKKSKVIFSKRYTKLQEIFDNKTKYIKVLDQELYTIKNFHELITLSNNNNWEGLMVRKDVCYEGKRTNNLLKYKEMEDDEYKVIDIETGPFRYINPSTGLEEEIQTMSAIIIDHNNTKVGSGFSIDERKMYYENKNLIVGKIVTIQYFEKTEDSLRFPVYKGIHGVKRET